MSFGAGFAVFSVPAHRVLMLRSAEHGLWELPGGEAERHESDPFETACREFAEETGGFPDWQSAIPRHGGDAVVWRRPGGRPEWKVTEGRGPGFMPAAEYHVFAFEALMFRPVLSREHADYTWCATGPLLRRNELKKRVHPGAVAYLRWLLG